MTDDLFVKMNARGKRLSRYDTFKSDLESALEKKQKNDAETETVDKWKQEIDNSILDGYFERFGAKYAERNLFRTILFYCKALTAMQKKAYDDSWEKDEKDANYQDEIALLQGDSSALRDLTTALSAFPNWYSVLKGNISRDAFYLKNFLSTEAFFFEHEDGLRGERTLNAKVRLFGVLYWFSKGLAGGEHFEQYARIVKNDLDSLRTPNNRPTRHYEFKVRGDSVWDTFRFLKNLVDRYLEKKDGCTDFYDYVKKTGEEALAFERDKLNSPDFSKILGLERLPYLGANIGNLFFDGRVHLDREEIQKLFEEELCDTDAKLFPALSEGLYLIGGGPKAGKTALLLTLAAELAALGTPVYYYSSEHAMERGAGLWKSLHGTDTGRLPIRVATGQIDLETLLRMARREIQDGVLLLDGLEPMIEKRSPYPAANPYSASHLWEASAAVVLKEFAKQCRLPVVMTVPLSRDIVLRADHRPTLSDLRYHRRFAEEADAVVLLYCEGCYIDGGDPAVQYRMAKEGGESARGGEWKVLGKLRLQTAASRPPVRPYFF